MISWRRPSKRSTKLACPCRTFEAVLLLHRHPGHAPPLRGQRVACSCQLLLLAQQSLVRCLPLLRGHDRVCLHHRTSSLARSMPMHGTPTRGERDMGLSAFPCPGRLTGPATCSGVIPEHWRSRACSSHVRFEPRTWFASRDSEGGARRRRDSRRRSGDRGRARPRRLLRLRDRPQQPRVPGLPRSAGPRRSRRPAS